VTVTELAEIMLEYGCYAALNFDGGGSATMVIEGADGKPDILNSPVDKRIPGLERAVANHLGIWARPLDQ
jgi:exopolysaccharide biosynthesis protein